MIDLDDSKEHDTFDMSWEANNVESPDDSGLLDMLCRELRELSAASDESGWPSEQLRRCGQAGVFRWFIPERWGGHDWNEEEIVRGYLKLSSACLKTTFVITQRTAACRRIAASQNLEIRDRLLPDLASGSIFATVGISHLTTSRRHLGRPILRARETDSGFVVNGFSPWVTGAPAADYFVIGAELDQGEQILFAVSADTMGVSIDPAIDLIALTGSHTGAVRLKDVRIDREFVLSGPIEDVMSATTAGGTGGLQTSTLAVGLATSAIDFLATESNKRPGVAKQFELLSEQLERVRIDLLSAARGDDAPTKDELRASANSLVLRATQSALVTAKGAGFVRGHPVGRWCKEALFFLVWSCPQSVLDANLCELSGTIDE